MPPSLRPSTVDVTIQPGSALELESVSVTTPDYRRMLVRREGGREGGKARRDVQIIFIVGKGRILGIYSNLAFPSLPPSPSQVRDLSLRLPPGGRLLIVGNSGTGKSSLLRVMAGLWASGSGKITRPSTAEMFFLPQVRSYPCSLPFSLPPPSVLFLLIPPSLPPSLPPLLPLSQRPYCTIGTLRDQLHYPQKPPSNSSSSSVPSSSSSSSSTSGAVTSSSHSLSALAQENEELLSILEAVNLGDLPLRYVPPSLPPSNLPGRSIPNKMAIFKFLALYASLTHPPLPPSLPPSYSVWATARPLTG